MSELRDAQRRWQAQYEAMAARMNRQAEAIERLVQANMMQDAALRRIADGDVEPGSMPTTARSALEAVAALGSGSGEDQAESKHDQPKEDR